MTKSRLLAFCDELSAPLGFAAVANHVIPALSDRFDITICPSALSQGLSAPSDEFGRIYSPSSEPELLPFGEDIGAICQKVKPDIVFFMHDLSIINWYIDAQRQGGWPTIAYFPIDGSPIPPRWVKVLHSIDFPITYTRFAYTAIRNIDESIECKVIPHGHDPQVFFPLDVNKTRAKQLARHALGLPQESFIVLRVDRNHERKNWPATLEAFAQFAANKPNAYLFIHSFSLGGHAYSFKDLIEVFGIPKDRILGFYKKAEGPILPASKLNLLYNAADVHLSTTSGGGWELTTHEAQAAGTPAIATDYASLPEVIANPEGLIPVDGYYVAARNSVRYALADVTAAVELLDRLYLDKALYNSYHTRCLEWARVFTWDRTVKDFLGVFSYMLRSM
jgi:glycosyltransferase involved in cell wall biosynthesis